MKSEMRTRVLELGFESDSSPDLAGLGLDSHTFELGLGLVSRYAGLGLNSDFVIEVIKTLKEF